MSSQIQCRQCGKFMSRSDFPTGQFKCPDCNWTQLMSTGRSRATKKEKKEKGKAKPAKTAAEPAAAQPAAKAAAASKPAPETAPTTTPAAERSEGPAAPASAAGAAPATGRPALPPLAVLDLDGLRALTPRDFTLWCTALLARFGYVVRPPAGDDGAPGHLEVVRAGECLLVDCVAFSERENVGRPECRTLLEAMERRGIARGMLLSPGSFENGCRAFAQQCGTGRIQLVDGPRLELTAREIANGPLAAWWG